MLVAEPNTTQQLWSGAVQSVSLSLRRPTTEKPRYLSATSDRNPFYNAIMLRLNFSYGGAFQGGNKPLTRWTTNARHRFTQTKHSDTKKTSETIAPCCALAFWRVCPTLPADLVSRAPVTAVHVVWTRYRLARRSLTKLHLDTCLPVSPCHVLPLEHRGNRSHNCSPLLSVCFFIALCVRLRLRGIPLHVLTPFKQQAHHYMLEVFSVRSL